MIQNGKCFVCGGQRQLRGDFGPQPVCNRFRLPEAGHEYRHALRVAQCLRCGLLQLTESWPTVELRPRVDWITYNEPDRHLDALCSAVVQLPGLDSNSLVIGLSYKDAPVLERLQAAGLRNTWSMSLQDWGIKDHCAGMESIQARLTPQTVARLSTPQARPDLVIARHVLEHSSDVKAAVDALRSWVRPGGYLVIEVPDSAATFSDLDYTVLWEEHVLYFTEATLRVAMSELGFRLQALHRYSYPLEDCLVAVVQTAVESSLLPQSSQSAAVEQELGERFMGGFQATAAAWRTYLQQQRARQPGGIALFGAGHRAAAFINLLQLGDLIDGVIDDDARKKGMLMPGSGLPILGSEALLARRIGLCLMALSPEAEEKVRNRQGEFLRRGGKLESIYPRSLHAAPVAVRTTSAA